MVDEFGGWWRHSTGEDVGISTSTPCKLQFSPCGRKMPAGDSKQVYFSDGLEICIDLPQIWQEIACVTSGSLGEHNRILKERVLHSAYLS